jgi:hypothetical protein
MKITKGKIGAIYERAEENAETLVKFVQDLHFFNDTLVENNDFGFDFRSFMMDCYKALNYTKDMRSNWLSYGVCESRVNNLIDKLFDFFSKLFTETNLNIEEPSDRLLEMKLIMNCYDNFNVY